MHLSIAGSLTCATVALKVGREFCLLICMNRWDVSRDCLRACCRSFGWSSRNASCMHQLFPHMTGHVVHLTNSQTYRSQGEFTQIHSRSQELSQLLHVLYTSMKCTSSHIVVSFLKYRKLETRDAHARYLKDF